MQYTLAFALNQRWCDGRASYRPPTKPIKTAEYDVAEIPDDTTAREFIMHHHYSHTTLQRASASAFTVMASSPVLRCSRTHARTLSSPTSLRPQC